MSVRTADPQPPVVDDQEDTMLPSIHDLFQELTGTQLGYQIQDPELKKSEPTIKKISEGD